MDANDALRLLLEACRVTMPDDATFDSALSALELLEDMLTRKDRTMPDGRAVVAELIAEGYAEA